MKHYNQTKKNVLCEYLKKSNAYYIFVKIFHKNFLKYIVGTSINWRFLISSNILQKLYYIYKIIYKFIF